jgi:hypothetical protein
MTRSQNVTWIRPDRPVYQPPLPRSSEQSERASALIVIALTLACTVLSIFDLFLLASGS